MLSSGLVRWDINPGKWLWTDWGAGKKKRLLLPRILGFGNMGLPFVLVCSLCFGGGDQRGLSQRGGVVGSLQSGSAPQLA